jgi:hypothetical protein
MVVIKGMDMKSLICHLLGHRWTKWKLERLGYHEFVQFRIRRECRRCGLDEQQSFHGNAQGICGVWKVEEII